MRTKGPLSLANEGLAGHANVDPRLLHPLLLRALILGSLCIIPIKGRGFINHGFGLSRFSVDSCQLKTFIAAGSRLA